MILHPRQAQRFYRIWDSFIAFAARRLNVPGAHARSDISDEASLDTQALLWEKGKADEVIDAYVSQNPDRLGKADLRAVSGWKLAIHANFGVVRDGRDVLFLYGDHAFGVRGITREVDNVAGPLPAFVAATILPFDGLVTYGMCLSSYDIDFGPGMRKSLEDEAAECRAKGCVVTTERDFVQSAPIARETELQHAAEDFAHRTELEMNAHELGHDQHEGALANLSFEEREKAIEQHLREVVSDERVREIALDDLKASSIGAAPARTLEARLAHLDRDLLMATAERFGVRPNRRNIGSRKLARLVAEAAPTDAESFVGTALIMGPSELWDLRRVYEAGGSVSVAEADVQRQSDVPGAHFPTTSISYANGVFTCTMVAEAMEALRDYDWDRAMEQARLHDRAARIAELAVDFRGVVPVIELVRECAESLGDELDPLLLLVTLSERSRMDVTNYDLIPLDEESYLVHHEILFLDDERYDADTIELDEDEQGLIFEILDAQLDKRPRPVAEFVDEASGNFDAFEWTMRQDAARELIAYLDAHVPDGQNDYGFADRVVEHCFDILRGGAMLPECLDILSEAGFMPTEAQLNHLLTLIGNFANNLPQWPNNGWTPYETMAGLASLGDEDGDVDFAKADGD